MDKIRAKLNGISKEFSCIVLGLLFNCDDMRKESLPIWILLIGGKTHCTHFRAKHTMKQNGKDQIYTQRERAELNRINRKRVETKKTLSADIVWTKKKYYFITCLCA